MTFDEYNDEATKWHVAPATARTEAHVAIDSANPYNGQTAMIDATTQKPLRISTDGTTGPYIMVPVSQLEDVRRLFDTHDVAYWVEEHAISLNDAPEIAVVNLDRGAGAVAVQAILDSVR